MSGLLPWSYEVRNEVVGWCRTV